MIAAIVLAAGKSERMGQPKALLRLEGRTFLERILQAIHSSRLGDTVIVVGHHRAEIESAAMAAPAVVFNPDYELGMITSVQAGIRALPSGVEGAALFLVDHPLVDAATIDALVQHLVPGRIVLPVHQGRRGHPVLVSADLFDEILAVSRDTGLHTVVRRDPSRVVEVAVASGGVLIDIDTPEQFEQLKLGQKWGQ